MSIRKRVWNTAKGEQLRWLVDYTDQSGTRRTKQFERRKDAAAFETKAKGEVRDGIHVADAATVTVSTAAAHWMTTGRAANIEQTTIAQRLQHINLHIVPFIGPLKLNKLSVPAIRDFQDRLRTEGRSAAMIRIVTTSLSSILSEAVERGLVSRNPVSDMRRAPSGEARKRRLEAGTDMPTPQEIAALCTALADMPAWRAIILTAIFSGMRASELRGLRWTDIDLQSATIQVRQRADRYNVIGRLKTKAAARTVPIGPLLVNTLREWKLRCPPGTLDLAFPDRRGGVMSHWSLVEAGLQPAMIRAGLTTNKGPKYPGMHALRHFHASWLINRRVDGGLELPAKLVQERLGHSSIVLTLNVYGHLFAPQDDGGQLAAGEAFLMKPRAT